MAIENRKNIMNFSEMRVEKLVDYLTTTHHESVKSAISRFNVYLKTIIKVDSNIHPEVNKISALINELTALMDVHMTKEEHILFPYISSLSKNQGSLSFEEKHLAENPINKIKLEHSKMTMILENIRKVSNNYLPSVNSSPALKLCYAQLFDFEQDIHRHIFLEEKILFPKVMEMENRNKNETKKSKEESI